MRRRGVGLGITLVVVALLALVGFTLAALAVSRLQLLSSLQQKRKARTLARSAIEAGMAKLEAQPTYGVSGGDAPITVPSDTPGWSGQLVFDPATAQSLGIPSSTNNLQGLSSVSSTGIFPQVVAASSARLVGQGHCGSCTEVVEGIFNIPPFPFALASAGAINCTGGLIVASVNDTSEASIQSLLANAASGGPANLVSNAAGAQSVQIGGPSVICGDLQTSGQVDFTSNPINVLGEVRENARSAPIPDVNIAKLDPTLNGLTPLVWSRAPSSTAVSVSGTAVCNGNFAISGNLSVSHGLLYVKGNLDVGGATCGTGQIVVTGDAHLRGATDLTTADRVCVMVGGNLTLDGASRSSSRFRGILYTRGRLIAQNLVVIGCLIGAPSTATGPQINLQDCAVVQDTSPVAGPASSVATAVDLTGAPQVPLAFTAVGPQLMKVTMGSPVTVDQVVNISDLSSVASLISALKSAYPQATLVQFQAPSPLYAVCTAWDLTNTENVQAGMQNIDLHIPSMGSSTMDFNQFLTVSDTLRLASCRFIGSRF